MKQAFTLIETMISMVIASILFLAIFYLTQVSLQRSRETMSLNVALGRELAAISAYDTARLAGQTVTVPTFLAGSTLAPWGITGESSLGYRGVLLP